MCIPPKKKGHPCVGSAIRTRICNKDPCPNVGLRNTLPMPVNDETHVTLKPIYKAMSFSKRPQQYVKCQIKENDILYKSIDYDPNKKMQSKYLEE